MKGWSQTPSWGEPTPDEVDRLRARYVVFRASAEDLRALIDPGAEPLWTSALESEAE